jgi:GNAT superfamily N-acetyltransferase
VKQVIWPEETADQELVAAVLESPDHSTLVAQKQREITGFVDGFLTRRGKETCWEVDLLAVEPESRGERLGEALVRANCAVGFEQGADACRSLIQVDNIASQKTFARCGFKLDEAPHMLFVTTEGDIPRDKADSARRIIPVVTMNYRGVWLESQFSYADLIAAKSAIGRDGGGIAGAVIPEALNASCQAAEALGYVPIGVYQWWHYRGG